MSDLNSMLSDFVDLESMVNEVEKTTTKKFWRPTKPKTTIRVLPPIKANGEKLCWMEHKVHWINGQPYECLSQTMLDKDNQLHQAEHCPLCKMAKTLYAAKTDEATELAKQISAKTRYVARVIVRDDNTLEDTPVFYELPFTIYTKFKEAILSKEWGSLVGPVDGRDMDVIKTGDGKYVKYDASSFKPMTSMIYQDTNKVVDVLKKAKDMGYNSLISFQNADALESAAMENSDISRFFGVSEPKKVQDYQETVSSIDDMIPEVAKADATPVQSSADELDSLLAGLI